MGSGPNARVYSRALLKTWNKEGFVPPTETNVHRDALCSVVMGRPLLQRLVVGGWWRLVVGGWWQLAVGRYWLVAAGGCRLAVGSGWHLAVVGWWSLGAVLKGSAEPKKTWLPQDSPGLRCVGWGGRRINPSSPPPFGIQTVFEISGILRTKIKSTQSKRQRLPDSRPGDLQTALQCGGPLGERRMPGVLHIPLGGRESAGRWRGSPPHKCTSCWGHLPETSWGAQDLGPRSTIGNSYLLLWPWQQTHPQ